MSTQTRLDAYLAAEAAILQAQEVRGDSGRMQRMAELREVRAQIDRLQAQLNRETAAATSGQRLNYAVANLSGESA